MSSGGRNRVDCSNIQFFKVTQNTVRIGIAGIGGYGRTLLELLLAEQHAGVAEVAAAVVVDPSGDGEHLAFLKSHAPGCRIYRSWEELLAAGEELDLMVLPVGIPFHADLTLAALAAGWNVLVEKPLAGSVSEGLRIAEAEERAGKFVAVGYQDMYGGTVREIKQVIRAGRIGSLRRIKAFAIWGRAVEYYQRNSWAGKLTLHGAPVFDSPFNNGLAHFVNMGLFLAGPDSENPATPVAAQAALFRGHRIDSCDTATIHWQTDAGVAVEVCFAHLGSTQIGPELLIEGSAGSIVLKIDHCWELLPDGQAPTRYPVASTGELRKAAIRTVVNKAGGGDVPVFTPRQSLAQVRATALAHAATVILDLPTAAITTRGTLDESGNSSHWIEVLNLEKNLRAAFEESRLLTLQDFEAPPPCV
jgi:predicted dehydrogenase